MNRLFGTGILPCSRRRLVPLMRTMRPVALKSRWSASRQASLSTKTHDGMPEKIASSMAAKSKEASGDDQHNKSYSFGKGFLHSLGQVYQETFKSELPPAQLRQMEAEALDIMQQLGDRTGSFSRAINFEFTAYMVAPYRILKASGTSVPQIRQLLEDALQHTMAWASQTVREQLDSAPDAFESLVKESKDKGRNFYVEPDFKLRRARGMPDSYSLEVHKCWYMNTLEKLGAREIGPSFCAFDRSWYAPIDPGRHGVKFTRPSTIAEGADRCRFNIDRVRKTAET